MLSWKSLTAWAISALLFASPLQGSEIIDGSINGANKCIAVDYDGSVIDTSIVSVYKEYSDCTLDEGGSFSSSDYCSDYSRCFRDKDGSNNRVWNTGCGWEIGYRNSDNNWVAIARSNVVTSDAVDCSTSGWTDLTLTTWYDASTGQRVQNLKTGYGACYKFPRPDKSTTTGSPNTSGGGGGGGTTGQPGTSGGGGGGEGSTTGQPGNSGGGGEGSTTGQPGNSGTGSPPGTSGGSPPATSGGSPPGTSGGSPPATSGGSPPGTSGGSPPATSGGSPPATSGGSPPATTGTGSATDTTATSTDTTTTSGTTVYTTVTEWQINVTIVTSNGDLLDQCANGDDTVVGPIVEESLTTVLSEYSSDFTLESVSATFENCDDPSSGQDVHTLIWMFKVTVTATVSASSGTTFDQTAFSNTLQADISGTAFTDELNVNLQAIYSDGDTSVSGAGVSMDNISVQSADTNNASDKKSGNNKELYLLIGIIAVVVIAAIAIIYGIVRYHNRRKQADSDLITEDQAGRIASLSSDPYAVGAVVAGTTATGTYGETNQPQQATAYQYQNYNGLAYAQPAGTDQQGKFLVMGNGIVPPAPALPGSYANNTETTPQHQSGEQESDEEASVPQGAVTVN